MTPYNIEEERRISVKRGPLGLFKRDKISIVPLGKIEEDQSKEVVSTSGLEMGSVELKKGVLEVSPKGNVVVDFGVIQGFKAAAKFINEEGKEEVGWVGSISTTDNNLTIRTEDGKNKVNFRKIP